MKVSKKIPFFGESKFVLMVLLGPLKRGFQQKIDFFGMAKNRILAFCDVVKPFITMIISWQKMAPVFSSITKLEYRNMGSYASIMSCFDISLSKFTA